MPVRIYDIAKKLGLENKEVLAKAKELGISAAKVPSSSLDKITAQYLEDELAKEHPQAGAAPPVAPVAPVAPVPRAPITIISEPVPEELPSAPEPVEDVQEALAPVEEIVEAPISP